MRRAATARAKDAATGPAELAGATIVEHRLRNGMQVLIAERDSDPVVAVMVYYRVGSKNEAEHEAGVSHFLEHMMFKGTKRLGKGEVDRLTTELGGSNNAFTSTDHTAYWFELASDRWETALAVEADRMRGLALEPKEFDSERQVVLEELAMGQDDPWRSMIEVVERAVFPRHPYGRPIIGFADTLARMTVADMRDYYARFYHPGNATLVICGDVRSAAAMRAVRKHFGSIASGPPRAEADSYRPAVEEPRGEQRLSMTWDDSARRVCMAWSTDRVCTETDFVLDVVSTLLTNGRTSRLQRRLVLDRGLAVSVSTSNHTRTEGGVFWLFAQCAQGVEPDKLEAAIEEELARMAKEAVGADELRRARSILASSAAFENETVSDLAENLGSYAVDAHWREALDFDSRYKQVTSKKLRDCVRRYLVPSRRVLAWSLPREASAKGRKHS